MSFVLIWIWVLSPFEYCLNFVTIWIIEFSYNLIFDSIWVLSKFELSQFEFLSFVIRIPFKFCLNLSFWVVLEIQLLCVCAPWDAVFFRPLIGFEITWPVSRPFLVLPSHPPFFFSLFLISVVEFGHNYILFCYNLSF